MRRSVVDPRKARVLLAANLLFETLCVQRSE
jgi:hypothetical protein